MCCVQGRTALSVAKGSAVEAMLRAVDDVHSGDAGRIGAAFSSGAASKAALCGALKV
jgi:hypothetical protein